jgi:quercetin dioxygenase-like cupin family protein
MFSVTDTAIDSAGMEIAAKGEVMGEKAMICRNVLQGQKLNVANLNEITVLVDRSETNLTEVAMNFWRADLNGPPHSHAGKEQVFYITEGNGVVHVGRESHRVKRGSLVYIPEGVVHQSIADRSALTYFLFNSFLEPTKEGCANYAEHIEKVKGIRQQQAATGKATADPRLSERVSKKKPLFLVETVTATATLVAHADTEGCEVDRVCLDKGAIRTAQYEDREQTLFVLSGGGKIAVDHETCELEPGTVAFIPANVRQSVEAGVGGLAYLSFSTFMLR